MRPAEPQSSRLRLRTGAGDAGEPGADEAAGSMALEVSNVWEPAVDGVVGSGGLGGEPQAGGWADGPDGIGGVVSTPLAQATGTGSRHLSVSVERGGGQWTGSGVVCGHHLPPYGLWVYVSSCGDGLVESLRAGLGAEQHVGGGVLHSSVGAGAGARPPSSGGFQHRPRLAVHQSGMDRRGGVGGGGGEHGWRRPMDGQPVHRTVVVEHDVRGRLPQRLRRRAGCDGKERNPHETEREGDGPLVRCSLFPNGFSTQSSQRTKTTRADPRKQKLKFCVQWSEDWGPPHPRSGGWSGRSSCSSCPATPRRSSATGR